MNDSLRDELAELVRLFGAHLAWQRELGVSGIACPSAARASQTVECTPHDDQVDKPTLDAAASRPQPSATRSEAPAAQPAKFEMPDFLRRRGASSAAVQSTPAAPRTPSLPLEPPARPSVDPLRPEAPPLMRSLFGDDERTLPRPNAFAGPVLEGQARLDALRVLNDQVVACTKCRLHEGRTRTVFARGNPFAKLAFVGEGPGRDEDLQGKPFVGAAGQLLDKIIAAMGLGEDDVYICNTTKCRPPNNRVPQPDELEACGPYLVSQLGLVRPEIIVALGKTAASFLLQSTASMTKLRGRWHQWQGVPLRVTWHPAYLLRQPEAKRDTWEDMKLVLQRMGRPLPSPSSS